MRALVVREAADDHGVPRRSQGCVVEGWAERGCELAAFVSEVQLEEGGGMSDNVVPFNFRNDAQQAATCGCGSQSMTLVCKRDGSADFVFCNNCQCILTRLKWEWVDEGTEGAR